MDKQLPVVILIHDRYSKPSGRPGAQPPDLSVGPVSGEDAPRLLSQAGFLEENDGIWRHPGSGCHAILQIMCEAAQLALHVNRVVAQFESLGASLV